MQIVRQLTKTIKKTKKSILLLGPRQTGKSTFINTLNPDATINLAHEPTFLELASDPRAFEARLNRKNSKTIFIDEVQRLPSLLNTVQFLIDNDKSLRIFLTGSSARKLRRGKANLLPGRIVSLEMGPLVATELEERFELEQALGTGTLPGIYLDSDESERELTLASYAATYLKEEIQAEALTKDLEGFARFLRFAAASAGTFLDITKLAGQSQVKRASAIRFFEILEDTLIAFRCDAFASSERRRLVQHPRFFFFDNGVLNGVLGNFKVSEDRRGTLFEHFVFTQFYHATRAMGKSARISNYRTEHGAEVDFIVELSDGETWAIECKSQRHASNIDTSGFKSFADFFRKKHRKMIVYGGTTELQVDDVVVLPVSSAIATIFGTTSP